MVVSTHAGQQLVSIDVIRPAAESTSGAEARRSPWTLLAPPPSCSQGLEAGRRPPRPRREVCRPTGYGCARRSRRPCRVVAPAVTTVATRESGFGEDPPAVFFRKSSASVSAPTGEVIRPAPGRLLDYELEVALVMAHQLPVGAAVTDTNLPGYVAAVVMCNDVSARDVELQKGQFYESKSYPTFTPTGPRLVLLDADDFGRLAGLRLRLWVNGE